MELPGLIFDDTTPFEERVRSVLMYQLDHNPIYNTFYSTLKVEEDGYTDPDSLPLIPIRVFKECHLFSATGEADICFQSSGTTQMEKSRHFVYDTDLYYQSILKGFDRFYSQQAVIWAYLPGYMDNPNSSLVWMLKALIERKKDGLSQFLQPGQPIDNDELDRVRKAGKNLILFGAAFGLLDLIAVAQGPLPEGSIVIETGGMKTHRREVTRTELHRKLANGFRLPINQIHSEYGMCELLSQAYAKGGNWFETVPWMKVTIRDPLDPSKVCPPYKEGIIGIVDLANLYSCPFLLTEDRGISDSEGRFQVLGRWNPENMRGCNFLIDRD